MAETFREDFIRQIEITSRTHIDKAWVGDHSVLLRNIKEDARICLTAETRALRVGENGRFELHSGPFMRRFLDGYYPMRISMKITFPSNLLKIVSTLPKEQAGFKMNTLPGIISFDTVFEGR